MKKLTFLTCISYIFTSSIISTAPQHLAKPKTPAATPKIAPTAILTTPANVKSRRFSSIKSNHLATTPKKNTQIESVLDKYGAGTGSYYPTSNKLTTLTIFTNVNKVAKSSFTSSLLSKGIAVCGQSTDDTSIFYGKPSDSEPPQAKGTSAYNQYGVETGVYFPSVQKFAAGVTYINVQKFPAHSSHNADSLLQKGYVLCGKSQNESTFFYGQPSSHGRAVPLNNITGKNLAARQTY